MRDVENDRSLSNSGRSTPTRGHREAAHKPPSVASPLTTPNESSSTSARALRAIETQDAARRAPGGLSRREVRDDDATTTRGDDEGTSRKKRSDGWFVPPDGDSSLSDARDDGTIDGTIDDARARAFLSRRMSPRRSRGCCRNKSARTT